jgi:flagellar biosynthesis chaperone FliJ
MKRQVFRLGSVLRFYELEKQRSEMELQRGLKDLHDLDAQITKLTDNIAVLAELVQGDKVDLTTTGWIACYRSVEHLGRQLTAVRQQRQKQAEVVAKLHEQRKHWAVAEETLLHLRKEVKEGNQYEAARAEQILADENEQRRVKGEW